MYSFFSKFMIIMGFPGGSEVKNVPADAGTACLIPGSRRSPGGGNGKPLLLSLLEKSHGQWSLVGYSPWCRKESGPTEPLTLIVLQTVLYSKVHKSTPTCLGCAHNNVYQICELTDVISH